MTSEPSRSLVLYYSRTGHSRRLAERLAEATGADLKALTLARYSQGVFGFLRAGFDSLRQVSLSQPGQQLDLSPYDRLILCGPVWTAYPAIPLRDILRLKGQLPPTVALFLTCGATAPEAKTLESAAADLGRPLAATASLPNDWQGKAREESVIAKFLSDLDAAKARKAVS